MVTWILCCFQAGSTSSKGGETELEEESEPETEEERPLTPVHRRRMKKVGRSIHNFLAWFIAENFGWFKVFFKLLIKQ